MKVRRPVPQRIQGPRIAFILIVIALILTGLVMVYSASFVEAVAGGNSPFYYLFKQAKILAVGTVVVLALVMFFRSGFFEGLWPWYFWLVCLILLIITCFVGDEVKGAKRWLDVGLFTFQPSELMKIALIFIAVKVVDDQKMGRCIIKGKKGTYKIILLEAVVGLLIPLLIIVVPQSDLGTTVVCCVGIFFVLLFGGMDRRILAVLCILIIVAVLIFIFGEEYRLTRLMTCYDPWNDGQGGLGDGYQLIRSFYAFAQGGITGVGLGNSVEKYLYLPERRNDFIFAIIGEEGGLVASLFVLALFLLMAFFGMKIAYSAKTNYGVMTVGGLTLTIVFQAFLNIACVVGLLPTTGNPLPFISDGGSSLLTNLLAVGVILALSRESDIDIHTQRRADFVLTTTKRVANPRSFEEEKRRINSASSRDSVTRGQNVSAPGSPGRRGRDR